MSTSTAYRSDLVIFGTKSSPSVEEIFQFSDKLSGPQIFKAGAWDTQPQINHLPMPYDFIEINILIVKMPAHVNTF